MHWPDEIRDRSSLLPEPVELSKEELEEAERLIDSLTVDELEGPEFVDHYTEALEQIIEAKREGEEPPEMPEPDVKPGKVVDVMAALQESVAKAKASRGEDASVHEAPKKKAATKKTAAKKQPAKKTAAKKTTKKAAGKKKTAPGRRRGA